MYQQAADWPQTADALPLDSGPGWGCYVKARIAAWRALLDRPLTSYYLVLGITILLLGLGLVMVESTASVTDLIAGLSPYSDFSKQLLGAAPPSPGAWGGAGGAPAAGGFRAFCLPAARGLRGRPRAHDDPRHRRLG